ncbi:uncharacterized protein N7479_003080 [Penicillium vulpinum]|uniref:uncharacterized protein n=1 Tax=Penicillium vulpinum TaxID=29845 RepID=UPI00254895D0|nr:uncharacterized protein N7479_003080 [Penicillium vulpinum]KAJ5963204.1 hypothetical protein N7479_003080 [Penicillium vulpinum]
MESRPTPSPQPPSYSATIEKINHGIASVRTGQVRKNGFYDTLIIHTVINDLNACAMDKNHGVEVPAPHIGY